MRLKRLLCFVMAAGTLFAMPPIHTQGLQSPALWGDLQPGAFAVGFRQTIARDMSRQALPDSDGPGRVVPIAIWYPAQAGAGDTMRLRHYVALDQWSRLGRDEAAAAAIEKFRQDSLKHGASPTDLDRLLDTPLAAVRAADPAAGRFPLVLFAHATPATESVMCEYLASHGFVVAAVSSRGATEAEYRLTRDNLDAMTADHDTAASYMKREASVAAGGAGIVGMSNGSIAGMALQLKRTDVNAIVSLDGGIGENAGGTYLNERSSGDVTRFTAPVLHLYAAENAYLNLAHLRSYDRSTRMLAVVRGMRHADFLAYPLFDRIAPRRTGSMSSDATAGFTWVVRYTERFLAGQLRENAEAVQWLVQSPESRGIPTGLVTIERLPRK